MTELCSLCPFRVRSCGPNRSHRSEQGVSGAVRRSRGTTPAMEPTRGRHERSLPHGNSVVDAGLGSVWVADNPLGHDGLRYQNGCPVANPPTRGGIDASATVLTGVCHGCDGNSMGPRWTPPAIATAKP